MIDSPIIESQTTAEITVGLYGENSQIIGKDGANGRAGYWYDNDRQGANGSEAISPAVFTERLRQINYILK